MSKLVYSGIAILSLVALCTVFYLTDSVSDRLTGFTITLLMAYVIYLRKKLQTEQIVYKKKLESLTHDFNGYLTLITTGSGLLLSLEKYDPAVLTTIGDAAKNLGRAFTEIHLDKQSVPLGEVLDTLESNFKDPYRDKKVSLKMPSLSEELKSLKITGSKTQVVDQILGNLIKNSLKFSKPDEVVKLNVLRNRGNVVVSIEDTAGGINPTVIRKIKKGQTNSSTLGSQGEEGRGLGLSIVWGTMKILNYKCDVLLNSSKAEKLRDGTTFRISIPLLS